MKARTERFLQQLKRANAKPCPWCGEAAWAPQRATARDYLRVVPRAAFGAAAHFFSRPKEVWEGMMHEIGFNVPCVHCGGLLTVCPNCDTPNRWVSVKTTCKSCGHGFL